jgi:ankyrin repeat protein
LILDQQLKAQPDAAHAENDQRQTPIIFAVVNYKLQFVARLAKNSDVCVKDHDGKTLLHKLIDGYVEHISETKQSQPQLHQAIDALISQAEPRKLIDEVDKHNYSALHYCVSAKTPDVLPTIKHLVEKAGAEINLQPPAQDVLLRAVDCGSLDVVKYFVSRRATIHPHELKKREQDISPSIHSELRKAVLSFEPVNATPQSHGRRPKNRFGFRAKKGSSPSD